MSHARTLPQLPQIGLPEQEYYHMIEEAERYRDHHGREAAKVGKYVTRAVNACSAWQTKEKCFRHALQHHCHPPVSAHEETVLFYNAMAHLVRNFAGAEFLKIVSVADDGFAARLARGEPREVVAREARSFFHMMIPHHHKPEWLNLEDYEQVKVFQRQWD